MQARVKRDNLERPHNHQIIISSDGSHTIYLPDLDETYHSSHGAIAESEHIYLKHGLQTVLFSSISILEVGFGTGLNALLSYQYANEKVKNILYETLEPYPLNQEIVSQLNYCATLGDGETFQAMHEATPAISQKLSSNFCFTKHCITIQEFDSSQRYDLIYFDAFAPSKQPEMWHIEILKKLFSYLNVGGILVTYCASGQFKRDLKTVGFSIETLEGPPPKKQITRASKLND